MEQHDYLSTMQDYTPQIDGTGEVLNKQMIVNGEGITSITASTEEEKMEQDKISESYMAPKTIEVSIYTLKK